MLYQNVSLNITVILKYDYIYWGNLQPVALAGLPPES